MIPRGAEAPAELLADLRRGEPVSHVAQRHGCSPRRARQWAREHCIAVVRGRPMQTSVTREQAISLVQSGHFVAVDPITPAPPTVGAGLDPNTLNDIRALVFLARIGFGTIRPTLDLGNIRFIEETIARLTQY